MRISRIFYSLLSIFCIVALACVGLSQEPTEAQRVKMATVAELAKPGPEHVKLSSLTGSWDKEIKYFPAPGKPPVIQKGTCENRMILGGRFLVSEAKGTLGTISFENTTIFGFDRRHNEYTAIALDTEGTYFVTAAGAFDEKKQAAVMYGEDQDPVVEHTQKWNFVMTFLGPDKYTLELIFKDKEHAHGLPEFKMLEIVHTRKK